jgi:hypothetical protein
MTDPPHRHIESRRRIAASDHGAASITARAWATTESVVTATGSGAAGGRYNPAKHRISGNQHKMAGDAKNDFNSFSEFYPYYLGEHSDRTCRRLHFVGTSLVIATLAYVIAWQAYGLLWLLPIFGYGFAWVGHFVFEKNKPATFRHPLYSLIGDFAMFRDMLTGKIRF